MKNNIQNILISNIYSYKNKGDAAIVMAMLDDIRNQYPNATLTLSSFDEEDIKRYGNYDVKFNILKYVYKTNDNNFSLLNKIIFFLIRIKIFEMCSKIRLKPYFLFSNSLSQKIREYADFDLVIAAGGGYLLTRTNGGIFPLLVTTYDFYIANFFNKPYILYNQSIGPFYKKWQFNLLKPSLRKAKKLILREDISFKRLSEYNLSNIILSSDIAFNLTSQGNDILNRYSFSEVNVNFGLTVRNWLTEDKQQIYESELAKFIETILSEDDKAFFYFIPQVIYSEMGDDDLVTSRKIFNMLSEKYKSRVVIIDLDPSAEKLKYIVSQMNYFIGTRMHSNIFALSSLVKTIAIAYEPKTTGIMKMLKLSDYVIQMDAVDKDKLYELFLKLKLDSIYLAGLSDQLTHVKNISRNNLSELL